MTNEIEELKRAITDLAEELKSIRKIPISEIQIGDIVIKSSSSLEKCLDTALKISGLKKIQNDLRIQEAWHL